MIHDPHQQVARMHVFDYIKARLEKTDKHVTFSLDEVYVVWFSKVLQNWKALVSTTLPDGMYYEVTYDGDKNRVYLDAYKKFDNIMISLGEDGEPEASGFVERVHEVQRQIDQAPYGVPVTIDTPEGKKTIDVATVTPANGDMKIEAHIKPEHASIFGNDFPHHYTTNDPNEKPLFSTPIEKPYFDPHPPAKL